MTVNDPSLLGKQTEHCMTLCLTHCNLMTNMTLSLGSWKLGAGSFRLIKFHSTRQKCCTAPLPNAYLENELLCGYAWLTTPAYYTLVTMKETATEFNNTPNPLP